MARRGTEQDFWNLVNKNGRISFTAKPNEKKESRPKISKYGEFQTIMRDDQHIVSAGRSMGYTVDQFEAPQPLDGFQGSQGMSAEIIFRKASLKALHGHCYGDIGFTRKADGTYGIIVDDLDRVTIGGDSWMGKLKQGYTEARQMAVAKLRGYSFLGKTVTKTDKGEKVQLLFGVR